MSVNEFFLIPEILFTTGITLYSILFAKSFKDMKGDISLGYLKKDDLEKLSIENRKVLRINLFTETIILTLLTILIGIFSIKLLNITLIGLITCLFLQIILTVILLVPFARKLKDLKRSIISEQ